MYSMLQIYDQEGSDIKIIRTGSTGFLKSNTLYSEEGAETGSQIIY